MSVNIDCTRLFHVLALTFCTLIEITFLSYTSHIGACRPLEMSAHKFSHSHKT